MHTILLFIHVILALVTLVGSVAAFQAIRHQQSAMKPLVAMWSSFAAVAITGGGLVFMAPGALGHTCVLLSVYVALTTSVQLYQKRALRTI